MKPEPLLRCAPNFRDLGGLPVRGGGRIRPGCLYRSDALDALDAADLARLAELAPKACCDLRSDGERRLRPHRWPQAQAPREHHLAVATDIRVLMPDLVRELRGNATEAGAVALMQTLYRDLPTVCVPVLRTVFALLLDDSGEHLPLVINCTAGKDRTGFVAAVLLHALGASESTIAADYLRSNDAAGRSSLQHKITRLIEDLVGHRAPQEMVDAVVAARLDYLDAALDRVREAHGSLDAYLRDALALDDLRRARLIDRLVDAG